MNAKQLLETEVTFFRSELQDFQRRYPGRYLLIHGRKLYGDYGTFEEAVNEGARRFKAGPFLVRQTTQPTELSQTVHVLKHGLLSAHFESPGVSH